MYLRRLYFLPLLSLLIISLLIGPAITSGYVWCVTLDGHRALETVIAGDCAADSHGQSTESPADSTLTAKPGDGCGPCLDVSTSSHWGNCRSRQDKLPATLPVDFASTVVVATVPLPARHLDTHRIDTPPRIPDPILYHRTIVLLI
jgi:hypothetical protein